MEIEEFSGADERSILIACVLHTRFLARVSGSVGREPFRSSWSNTVYSWCIRHYTKHGRSPKKQIIHYYESWSKKARDKQLSKVLNRFLSALSGEAERNGKIDYDHTLALAEDYFTQVRLEKIHEELKEGLKRGTNNKLVQEVQSFKAVNLRGADYIDILHDKKAQKEALEAQANVIVRWPGAAGEFFGSEFAEDSLVGIMAIAKGGKSFTCMQTAELGARQGHDVGYFQVGDLSKNQIIRRFQKLAARRPLHAKIYQKPTSIYLPEDRNEIAVVETKLREFESDLTWEAGEKAYEKLAKRCKGKIALSYHPTKTVNARDVHTIIAQWYEAGFKPKLIVLDYAGNLAPIDFKVKPDEQIADTWAELRHISEKFNLCFVTPNQANAKGFRSYILTRDNFRGSLMILAHVTAFLGINSTDEEKTKGILRYNFVVRRDDNFSESHCLHAASCLEEAKAIVLSCTRNR
jgi:hypothetical protein